MKRQRSAKTTQLFREKNVDYERHHELFNFTKSVLDLEAEIDDISGAPSAMIVNNKNAVVQSNELPDVYNHIDYSNANFTINEIPDDSSVIPELIAEQGTAIRDVEGKWSIDQNDCIKLVNQSVDQNLIGNIQLSRVYFSQKNTDECNPRFKKASNQLDDVYMSSEQNYEHHPASLSPKRRKVTFNDIVSKQYVTNTRRRFLHTTDASKSNLKGLFQKSAKQPKSSNISANHYLYFLPKKRRLTETNSTKSDDRAQIGVNHISNIHMQDQASSLGNARFVQTYVLSEDEDEDNDDDDSDENEVDEEEEEEEEDEEQNVIQPQMQVVLGSDGRVLVTNVLPTSASSKAKGTKMTKLHRNSSEGRHDNLSRNASFYCNDNETARYQLNHDSPLITARELRSRARRTDDKRIGGQVHKSAFKAYNGNNTNRIGLERKERNVSEPHDVTHEMHTKRTEGVRKCKSQRDSAEREIHKLQADIYQREHPELRNNVYQRDNYNRMKEYHNDNNAADSYRFEHRIDSRIDNIYNHQYMHGNHYRLEGFRSVHDVSVRKHGMKTIKTDNLLIQSEASKHLQNTRYLGPENAHLSNSVDNYRMRIDNTNNVEQTKAHGRSDHESGKSARNSLLIKRSIVDMRNSSSKYMCTAKIPSSSESRERVNIADGVELTKSDGTAAPYIGRHFVDSEGNCFIAVYPDYGATGLDSKTVEETERSEQLITTPFVSPRRHALDNRTDCHVHETTGLNIKTTTDSHANAQHYLEQTVSSNQQHTQLSTQTPYTNTTPFVISQELSISECSKEDDDNCHPYFISGPLQRGHRISCKTNLLRSNQVETNNNIERHSRCYDPVSSTVIVNDTDKNDDDDDDNGRQALRNYYQSKERAVTSAKQPEQLRFKFNRHQHTPPSINDNDIDVEHVRYKCHDHQTERRFLPTTSQNGGLMTKYRVNAKSYTRNRSYHHQNGKSASNSKVETVKHPSPTVNQDKAEQNEGKNANVKDVSILNAQNVRHHYTSLTTIKHKKDKEEKLQPPVTSSTTNNTGGNKAEATSTNTSTKVNEEENRYKCEWPACTKSFRHYSFLVLHRRIHSGERPYICSWEGCKKQFRRSDDYQRHYRVHTGVRPFPCEVCGKSFKRSDHRLFHYRAIHNLHK